MRESHQLLLNEREAAQALRISVRHLQNLRRAGKIPYVTLGHRVAYPLRALEEWIATQCQKRSRTPKAHP